MKRLKFRYKRETEHEYKETLAISTKKTLEKLCSGVDYPVQAPAFDYDNQDLFLDSEYTIKELNFAIENLKSAIEPMTGWNRLPYNAQFSKLNIRNSVRNL
jgi:hypothetical protein